MKSQSAFPGFAHLNNLAGKPWLAEAIAILGGIFYTFMVFTYAHTRQSILDEGAYLYKGYLFATGQYIPYQDYGPWTNHTPLAFLVPGWLQVLFGPGLRTGRYFAVFVALLMLLGLWILARRLGNRWWAAGAVWVLAINPFLMKTYSIAITQGLVACLLIWTLVFVIGEKKPLWQIIIGSALAAITVMTRINLLPVLPLVILFVFWQHGKKAGVVATLSGGLVFLGIHAYYWPEIMQLWSRLRNLLPLPNLWRSSLQHSRSAWQPEPSLAGRVLSFFSGISGQFTAMAGVLATLLLWPRKDRWKNQSAMRNALFIAVLFFTLFIMHFWAALGKKYCVSCFPGYLAFFSELGLLLIILTALIWRKQLPIWYQVLIFMLVLGLFTGIGFGSFETLGEPLTNLPLPHWLVGSASADVVSLGAVLTNKFGIDAKTLRRLLPVGLGSGVGLLTLGVAFIIYRRTRPHSIATGRIASFGYWAIIIMLIAGTILTPTPLLGSSVFAYNCTGDVIFSYETAGKHLAENIPPGSSVFWKGGLSVVPLLYVPDIKIFPAQINGDYSFQLGDSQEPLDKDGLWNQRLANQWANEADYILVEEHYFTGWMKEFIQSSAFQELTPTPPAVPCRDDSQIRIFKKIKT